MDFFHAAIVASFYFLAGSSLYAAFLPDFIAEKEKLKSPEDARKMIGIGRALRMPDLKEREKEFKQYMRWTWVLLCCFALILGHTLAAQDWILFFPALIFSANLIKMRADWRKIYEYSITLDPNQS